jgi:hypothetical protein
MGTVGNNVYDLTAYPWLTVSTESGKFLGACRVARTPVAAGRSHTQGPAPPRPPLRLTPPRSSSRGGPRRHRRRSFAAGADDM